MNADLLEELENLAVDWDQQARDRHNVGMSESAQAFRDCRDDLQRLVKRTKRTMGSTSRVDEG